MKKWVCFTTAAMVIVGTLAGVVYQYEKKQKIKETEVLSHAELTISLIGSEPKDMDMVLKRLNELTERDLNCSVDIEWIGKGEYNSRYPILLTTDKHIDLIYASNWLHFIEHAQRGAFAPLDDLVEQYAPETNEILTEAERKQATVDDNLYAIPSNYVNYNALGVIARGDLMDKYQIDSIDSFDDYLDFCDVISREEGMDPTGMCAINQDMITLYVLSKGYYPVTGDNSCPYWVDLKDKNFKVYFQSECPEVDEYLSKAEEWFQKGYWRADVLASKEEMLLDVGLAASRIHNYDAYLGEYGLNQDKDIRYYNLVNPIVRQTALQDAMAIPALSTNKERAMMLLEKLRNDEEYYMLLMYGIEGYHYTKADRQITFLNNDYGNEPGTWGIRDERYKCWDSILPDDALEMRSAFKKEAVDTPLVNFDLDLDSIGKQYEKIQNVMDVYYAPLKLGYIDYDEGMKELALHLKEAGNEEVKAEIQRQIQEYLEGQTP